MTNKEAIERLKKRICCEKPIQHLCTDNCLYGIEECEIGLAIEALEKQIPKKTIKGYTCKANNDSWRSCPECHARQWNTHKYCSQCGQRLDWGE